MKIETINPVLCRIRRPDGYKIASCLSCKSEYWKENRNKPIPNTHPQRYVKERFEYDKSFFVAKKQDYWYFYRGHLERVIKHVEDTFNEPAEIFGDSFNGIFTKEPKLNSITFRKDQLKLMQYALEDTNGIILSPTGSGKTILQLGLMSTFSHSNILLLAHTVGIIQQTFEELQKFGFQRIQQIGGGKQYKGKFARVVVSTVQSFSKIEDDYSNFFDVVMVDEAHRVSSLTCTYAKVLSKIMAPYRLGFTATLPTSEEAQMSLEGLIGPVIGELTISEASELGILAKPKVKLVKSEFSQRIRNIKKYPDVYQIGIVENNQRNQLIVDRVSEHKKVGDVSLIFVNRIEHGENLVHLFQLKGCNVPFVRGDMQPQERQNIRHSLMERRLKIAIATTAWREGINIPSLDVIFNAGGGKDELGVIQLIGRGLRRTEGKEEVTIYDVFDPSHYFLISHFGERITLYMENNWL